MGHIALPSPVTNMLILKNILPYVEKLLGIPGKVIKDLIYFNSYIVTDKGNSKILQNKQVFTSNKVEIDLIINVLDEIIQTKKIPPAILKEAQELQANLISQKEKKTRSQKDLSYSETEAIFLEDYLEFLRKH
jgi:DNA-directed RNA polymerase subunit beta'